MEMVLDGYIVCYMVKIFGQKIGMTQLFDEKGVVQVATVIRIPKHTVTYIKSKESDGYESIQLGAHLSKKTSKSVLGKLSKVNIQDQLSHFIESAADRNDVSIGDVFDVSYFSNNEKVTVIGVSKGKGFTGTIKRHGFHRGPKTHGSNNYRQPGSIGSAYPERVVKGKKMAGHMGHERITVKGIQIIKISPDDNTIVLNGPVPGPRNSYITLTKELI